MAARFEEAWHTDLAVHEVCILGLLTGLDDLNVHEEFRKDPVAGAVLGCLESQREDREPLAGQSTLVVWRLDRLARSLRPLIVTFEDLDARGIGFRWLTETIDTNTPDRQLIFHILAPWPSSRGA